MPTKVYIPTPLRPYTDKLDVVEVEGATVGEVLGALTASFADLRRHLYGDDGKLRRFVNVYVNDDDIRFLEREATPLKAGDTISIIPSVAGGSDAVAEPLPSLSHAEVKRYSRHLIMPEVGLDGQRRLKAASVLCIGAGGLGSPAALYLAAAGIGRLGIVDFDVVDFSNLQRQVLHGTPDVGRPKLDSARARLTALNPEITIDTYETPLTSKNALELFAGYDLVLDGTDNFPTRYLVNDACVLLGKPNAYGSIFRFEGQASVFAVKDGPCYRCLYPEPPPPGLVPSCAEGGVLGVLPGVIGTIQSTEVIKLITGIGETLVGRLMLYDALAMRFRELKLRRNPQCPVCGEQPSITELIDYEVFCGIVPEVHLSNQYEITPLELAAWLERDDRPFLLDVRNPYEVDICSIPGTDKLIPVDQLAYHVNELDSAVEMVVYCRSGARSGRAVEMLKSAGFRKIKNLVGGVLRWSDDVDPSMPKY